MKQYREVINFLKIFLIGVTLTLIFTWPLVTKLKTFYSDTGDYPINGYILWYNQNSIKTGRVFDQHLYFNAPQSYPLSYTLAATDHMFFPSLLFSPLYWLTNNLVTSVNIFYLTTFIFTFLLSYFSLQFFLKNKLASIIGATTYTFNPLFFAHSYGHINLMNKFFLPLVFLCTYNYFKKPDLKNTFLFWLFFMLNSLTATYFFTFTFLQTVVLFFVFAFIYHKNNKLMFIKNLLKTVIISIPFLFIIIYFYFPYLDYSNKEKVVRSIFESSIYSANITDFFRPLPNNLVYKYLLKLIEGVPSNFNYSEHVLFLNIIPIILAILGSNYLNNIRKKSLNNSIFFWVVFILLPVFFILSFGPFLNLIITEIKLPYFYLKKFTPIFTGIRAPSRFMFMFYFPFSLLIGYGFIYITKKTNIKNSLIFTVIFLLIIAENIYLNNFDEKSKIVLLMNHYKQSSSRIFTILHGKNTLHFPIGVDGYGQAKFLTWSTYTNENLINGYSGFDNKDWLYMFQKFKGEFSDNHLRTLRLLDVDYLIIHKTSGKLYKNKYFIKNTVFEDNNIIILNLLDKNLNRNRCNSDRKLSIYLVLGSKISIENNNNCYIVNKYDDRYLKIFNNSYITLPIIINPQEKLEYSNLGQN